MGIWNKKYCDFVCWTIKGYVITRIQYNNEFFEGFVEKCKHFFDKYVLPELMTRKLQFSECSLQSGEDVLYCYYKTPEEPDNPMIGCDAPDCPNGSTSHVLESPMNPTVMNIGFAMNAGKD